MSKPYLSYNKLVKFFIILLLLLSNKAFSVVGHDDRFYIHGTKWGKLLNGIIKINECTGFVLEGDVILTVAHCFDEIFSWDENSRRISYDSITKDSKINYKNLKHIDVYFGDANVDTRDKSERSHFADIEFFKGAKALFLGHNPIKVNESTDNEKFFKDYAFIKLEKAIPKNIKRFKIFNSDLLKDYDILKHSYRGGLSTAGYNADNMKTEFQRLAHLGCKVRSMKQYKKVWFEYSDCDTAGGGSGSPVFYILRHKKTRKIEIAVSSMLVSAGFIRQLRDVDHDIYMEKGERLRKDTGTRYRLAFSNYYNVSPFNEGSFTVSLLLTNHKEFLNNLETFKKDPFFFRNQKIAELEKNKYLNKKWIYKNIIQKKSLKELEDFIYKDLAKLSLKHKGWNSNTEKIIVEISQDQNYKIEKGKREFLNKIFYYYSNNFNSDIMSKYKSNFYPHQKRTKRFSKHKIDELTFKYHSEEDWRKLPYENLVKDKKKAKKLWKMYFSK